MNNSGEGDRIKQLAAQNGIELDPSIDYNSNPMEGWNTHVNEVPEQTPNYGNSGLVTRISRSGEDVTGREDESGDISQMFESPEDAEQFSGVINDRIQNEVQQLDGEAKAPMIAEVSKFYHQAVTDDKFLNFWENVDESETFGYQVSHQLAQSLQPYFGEDATPHNIAAYAKFYGLSQRDLNNAAKVLTGGNAAALPANNNDTYSAPHQQANNNYAQTDDDDWSDEYPSGDTNNSSSSFDEMQHREEVASGLIERFALRNHTTSEYIKEAIAYVFPQLPIEEQDNIINHPSVYMQPLLDKIERGWNKKRAEAKQPSRTSNNNVDNKLYSWKKLQSLPQDRYQAAMQKLERQYGENWSAHVDFSR